MTDKPTPGSIAWMDLTVGDAEGIRDFYQEVTGWRPEPVPMGDYSDFVMSNAVGEAVSGICHARGPNADLPAQWLMYLVVENLEVSMAACRSRGGSVLAGPKSMGSNGNYCVIQDPAGAVTALIEP